MAGGGIKINNIKVSGGADGATFIPYVDDEGNLSWSNNKGYANPPTVNIKGENGVNGKDGKTGAKIISQTFQGTDANGGNVYLQTFDDGTTTTFTAPKGEQGEQGEQGRQGVQGQNGIGIPQGGATGQILIKASEMNYDTMWKDINDIGGVGGSSKNIHSIDIVDVVYPIDIANNVYSYSPQYFEEPIAKGDLIIDGSNEIYLVTDIANFRCKLVSGNSGSSAGSTSYLYLPCVSGYANYSLYFTLFDDLSNVDAIKISYTVQTVYNSNIAIDEPEFKNKNITIYENGERLNNVELNLAIDSYNEAIYYDVPLLWTSNSTIELNFYSATNGNYGGKLTDILFEIKFK